jgi:hypothetical protein
MHPTQIKRTIESLIEGVTDSPIKSAEVLTSGGLQGVTLIPHALGNEVIKKYNPDLLIRI